MDYPKWEKSWKKIHCLYSYVTLLSSKEVVKKEREREFDCINQFCFYRGKDNDAIQKPILNFIGNNV